MRSRFMRLLMIVLVLSAAGYFGLYRPFILRAKTLDAIVARLSSDSRIAEVIVTDAVFDELTGKTKTTIKFLEYDSQGSPLRPRYFTFPDNLIQFQSLVVRFSDRFVRSGDKVKGKSAFLFWKVFCLNGSETEEYLISDVDSVPEGYRLKADVDAQAEAGFWSEFWEYALDSEKRASAGIKNLQVEAPGTLFVPGYLYTLVIEHDGGIRIDSELLPGILQGERLPSEKLVRI